MEYLQNETRKLGEFLKINRDMYGMSLPSGLTPAQADVATPRVYSPRKGKIGLD